MDFFTTGRKTTVIRAVDDHNTGVIISLSFIIGTDIEIENNIPANKILRATAVINPNPNINTTKKHIYRYI
jgi:hypothetical protein